MLARRSRPRARNVHGVASIKRDSYSTVNGFTQNNSWWELRAKAYARDKGVCQALIRGTRCLKPGSEVHHIQPLNAGGTNNLSNLILLCQACHDRRHPHLVRAAQLKKR